MNKNEYRATQAVEVSRRRESTAQKAVDLLIIGNGIAGLTAAVEARKRVPDMQIVIATDQPYPTINTPALKGFASGRLRPDQLLAFPAGIERASGIHVVHERVERIDAQGHGVGFSGNRWFGYRSLLLATGSIPQGLPPSLPGVATDGVLTLHRLEDYRDLRRRLPVVSQAVVVGSGVHACETVMSLLKWHIKVYWLIRGDFLSKQLDQTASSIVLSHMRSLGAQIATHTEVIGVISHLGTVAGVLTNQQQFIPCQLVLACTGTVANTALAASCTLPLKLSRGIMVDDRFRTSVPDIYAIGDVAALRNPLSGAYEPRAQWYAATLQARKAAELLTGHRSTVAPFGVPWHATQLGELSLLTVGDPLTEISERSTYIDTRDGYRRIVLSNDRLIGYLALGKKPPDSLAFKQMIDEEIPIADVAHLLDSDFDARAYIAGLQAQRLQSLLLPKVTEPAMGRRRRSLQPVLVLPGGDASSDSHTIRLRSPPER